MMPAQPPPPTNWNLPFQPEPAAPEPSAEAGSQASISISESDEGRRIALIRQCAGNISGGAAGGPPGRPRPRPSGATAGTGAGPRPGAMKGPAGTISAATIVVPAREIDFSDSHEVDDDASVADSAST